MRWFRFKFTAVVTMMFLLVFVSSFMIINYNLIMMGTGQYDEVVANIIDNDGVLSEAFIQPQYFSVKLDRNGGIIEVRRSAALDLTDSDAVRYAKAALGETQDGNIENFRYFSTEKPYGSMIVFVRQHIELIVRQHINVSFRCAVISCVFILVFSMLLSRWAANPAKAAFENQKRFISDAGHELKTPLTILSTGIYILENEIGEHDRIPMIKRQIERMGGLINDMLTLAIDDDNRIRKHKPRFPRLFSMLGKRKASNQCSSDNFDLSSVVLIAAIEFEGKAFEEDKTFDVDVAEGLTYSGSAEDIRKLVQILIDNAIKYSGEKGLIKVSLYAPGNSRPVFSVYNTGSGIPDNEQEKVFNRFYRCDESRSRKKGGYGLGLAIAKSIVERHCGKITIEGKTGEWIKFIVKL